MAKLIVTQNFKANGFKGIIGRELGVSDLEKIGEKSLKHLIAEECIFVDEALEGSVDLSSDQDIDNEDLSEDLGEDIDDGEPLAEKKKGKKKKG